MECKGTCLLLLLGAALVGGAAAARVLAVFPTETRSHYVMYSSIMRALAQRGHQVTVATHFPATTPVKNMTYVSLAGLLTMYTFTADQLYYMTSIDGALDVMEFNLYTCDALMKAPILHKLIEPGEYDLFVTEMFGSECILPLGHKLGVPMVGLVSSVLLPWMNDMVGNPEDPAYIPVYFSPFTQRMDFLTRLANTALNIYLKVAYEISSNWKTQTIVENTLGPVPNVRNLARNLSLIITNSHWSINQVRPMSTQVIEVGGAHIPSELDPLPADIEQFLNEAVHGVVYFSLGTVVPLHTLAKDRLNDIIDALGSIKQRVLWKVNATDLPPLPPNIKTSTWLPQIAILCHPATKAFISHGGLLGIQETVHCGVPILGIPIFADQRLNLKCLHEKGAAEILEYPTMNRKTLLSGLNKILTNDSYKKSAMRLSQIFKDRPQKPLDTAVYWLEYVMKYGGAAHLRSPALELTWYQRMLLDVILFTVVCVLTITFILYYFIIFIKKILVKFTTKAKPKEKKDKNLKKE